MPQIKQYEQQVQAAGPQNMQSASAADFGSDVGAANAEMGRSADKIGEALKQRQAQNDLSNLDAEHAKAQDELGLEYQDQLQKGTLNHDDFMEKVHDKMDAIGQKVETREGQLRYQQLKAASQLSFSQEAQKGQAEIAGDRAASEVKGAANSRSSFVYNNPARFQQLLDEQNQSIDDKVALHGLPASKAPELKRALMDGLASNAVRGLAKGDPDEAARQLADGVWDPYLSENARQRLDTDVKQQKMASRQDEERAQKLAEKAASAQQEATVSGFLQKMHGDGPGVSSNDVLHALQSNKIDSGTAEKLWKMVDQDNQDKKIKSDPHVFNDLTQRIALPDGDPRKITDAEEINKHLGRDVSIPDANLLYGLLGEKHTPQGEADTASKNTYLATVKNTLIKNPMLPDPKGLAIYQQVEAQSYQYSLEASKNGKSKMQIWSPILGGKPNPDYVGNHVAVPHRSLEEIINDTAERMSSTGPDGEERISVISPTGVRGKIPKSKLSEKLKAGYTEVGQ